MGPRCAVAAAVCAAVTAIGLAGCSGTSGVSTDYIESVPTATLPAEFPPATIVGGSAPTSPGQQRTYEIQPDDTVAGIAETFGVTIEAILEANPGLDPTRLVIGERIVIPAQAGTPSPTRAAPTATPRPEPTAQPAGPSPTPVTRVEDGRLTYVVQQGDYPELIAQKFGISTEDLLAANPGIDPRGLHIGDVLVIPTPTPTPGGQ